MQIESLTREFKQQYTPEIVSTIISFANTLGGELYIGIADDSTVIGVDDPDAVALQVVNTIRDSIRPDITPFVRCENTIIDGKNVIHVTVKTGINRPYYLAGKGPKPSGVFVRQGPSTVSASPDAIVEMIKDARGETFESLPCFSQTFTFDKASSVFQKKGKNLGSSEMLNFRIILTNNVYTNLAELLSDQCTQRIRIAVFNDIESIQVRQRRDVGGSLLNQVEEAYEYLLLNIPTRSDYQGINRIDYHDFPLNAVREALMNLIVHRDYSMNADARINIYPDRIEFISPGGLPNRVTMQDLNNCLSIRRNPNLARVFEKLDYIEAMGIGLPLIRNAYKNNIEHPIIQPAPNSFRVVLPKLLKEKSEFKTNEEYSPRTQESFVLDTNQGQLIEFLEKHGPSSRLEIQNNLQLSQPTISRLINELLNRGSILKIRTGRNVRYSIKR